MTALGETRVEGLGNRLWAGGLDPTAGDGKGCCHVYTLSHQKRESGVAKIKTDVHHGRLWGGGMKPMQVAGNRSVVYETKGREQPSAQQPRAVVASCLVSECAQHCALASLLCIHTGGWWESKACSTHQGQLFFYIALVLKYLGVPQIFCRRPPWRCSPLLGHLEYASHQQ